jgi:hypothetical protein
MTEQRDLMNGPNEPWSALEGIEVSEERIVALSHEDAYELFMERFIELREG